MTSCFQTPRTTAQILHEDRPDRGHWTGLLKYDGLVEQFDSYGNKVDAPLRWINMKQRRLLGQAEASLSRLLAHEYFMHNHVEYQNKDSSINTCGSHVCHRVYRLKHEWDGPPHLPPVHADRKSVV